MCLHASVLLCLVAAFSGTAICQSGSLKGIDVADLDKKVDPCNDFYEYSNGTWRAQNPIPNSMDRWSRRWKAGETNKDQLKIILDDVSSRAATKGTPAQLTGDFYAACTNQKAVDDAIKTAADLMRRSSRCRISACRSRSICYPRPMCMLRRT
jgi:endothelin-converting enzyme/putative endopeptidase